MLCGVLSLGTKFFFPSGESGSDWNPYYVGSNSPLEDTCLRIENFWTCFAICEMRLVLASVLRDSWLWMSSEG